MKRVEQTILRFCDPKICILNGDNLRYSSCSNLMTSPGELFVKSEPGKAVKKKWATQKIVVVQEECSRGPGLIGCVSP